MASHASARPASTRREVLERLDVHFFHRLRGCGLALAEETLDLLRAAVRHDFLPPGEDQAVAKAALRHLDVVGCIPPDLDRIVIRETRMDVADHEQERALTGQPAVGAEIKRAALHLALGERLVQRPL
jgi:hypothetical protein